MIATTVTLRIFFYGLIAFTPDEFVCGGLTRALLLDAQAPSVASDGCLLHPHDPVLYYKPKVNQTCGDPLCPEDTSSKLCRCLLNRKFLIDIPAVANQSCQPGQQVAGAGDFNNLVPKLSRTRFLNDPFGRSNLRDECNHQYPNEHKPLCNLLAAQINFHPTDVKACLKVAGDFEIHPSEGMNLSEPDYSEMAEVIVFEVPVQVDDGASHVVLMASRHEGQLTITVPIFKLDAGLYADIAVTNEPAGRHVVSGPCDASTVARDFSLFYDLAASPPERFDRGIPQATGKVDPVSDLTALCRRSLLLKILMDKLTHAGNARPICPEATFSGAQ